MLYDTMMVLAIVITTAIIVVRFTATTPSGFWWQSLLFCEWFAFFLYFWCNGGKTIGMMAWRLKVQSDDGAPLSPTQATTRFAAGLLSAACLGLGYLWALVDPLNRTWSDMLSGSHIIVEPKQT